MMSDEHLLEAARMGLVVIGELTQDQARCAHLVVEVRE